jgi:hypothetical protein
MPNMKLLLLGLILGVSMSACVHSSRAVCGHPSFSVAELRAFVDAEIRRRGLGNPEAGRRTKPTVTRDGCDYIYVEDAEPNSPGGWLFARISIDGKVINLGPGD